MAEKPKRSDSELLKTLCDKHDLDVELVESLLNVEREFQHLERRHGLIEKLREKIVATQKKRG